MKSPDPQPLDLRRAVLQQVASLQSAGLGQLPKGRARGPSEATSSVVLAPTAEPRAEAPAASPPLASLHGAAANPDVVAQLEILSREVAACRLCDELASTRTQTVFGVGDPRARLCLLGEAPGADEDRLGEPFVGRAGQLLNKIIEACRMKREDVYILNVLKCRPPGNRNPSPDEAQNCRKFLDRQLDLVAPEFICCLGSVAAQNLLATTQTIGRLRGSVHDYRGIRVVCTYHPAYLLRNPAAKKDAWDDMKLLMREMGTPVD